MIILDIIMYQQDNVSYKKIPAISVLDTMHRPSQLSLPLMGLPYPIVLPTVPAAVEFV